MAWLNPTYGVYRVISPTFGVYGGCHLTPTCQAGILISNESKDFILRLRWGSHSNEAQIGSSSAPKSPKSMGNHHYTNTKCWTVYYKDLKQHKWQRFMKLFRSLCIRNIWGSIWCRTLRTGNTGNNWAAFQKQYIHNDRWIEQASSKAFKLLKQATITSHQCCKQLENFHHVHPFGRWYSSRFYASSGWNKKTFFERLYLYLLPQPDVWGLSTSIPTRP